MNQAIGERILLTLWIGGMWTVGFVVAPTLFQMLDDRAVAGQVAGRLFTIISFIGLGAGGLLLVGQLLGRDIPWLHNWRVWLLAGMLLMIVLGQFVLQPMMAELKAAGLTEGSPAAQRFGLLHGGASLLFLINSLLGLALVVFGLDDSRKKE